MEISLIVALTKNRVIGDQNTLIWHIPEDQKLFRKITSENTVIMGRKTWDSLPVRFRPLPNRNNIVISRSVTQLEGADVCSSLDLAMEKAKSYNKDIIIMGGVQIYALAIPIVEKMHLSWVKKEYEGDAKFPEFNKEDWNITEEKEFDEFTYKVYERKVK